MSKIIKPTVQCNCPIPDPTEFHNIPSCSNCYGINPKAPTGKRKAKKKKGGAMLK